MEPGLGRAHLLVASLIASARYAEALAHIEEWQETEPNYPWTWAWAACVHGRAGQPEEARRAVQRMEELNDRAHFDPIALHVTAYAGMEEKDKALAWLERACKERPSVLTWLKVDPLLDPLRGDPRFTELLRCARFIP